MILEEKKQLLNMKRVFLNLLYNLFLWDIYNSKKNWATYDQQRKLVIMWSVRYYCQILMKLKFCGHIYEK
jgi:hypothetical protein